MKYGFFDDANREYVITTPKTPYPWINYFGCEDFFSLFSNTSGGYCFYKDARLRRITRYRYNNVPIDNEGRYFYIKERDEFWSPAWKAVKSELDFYECRHGLGYSVITGIKNNLEVKQTSFVPLKFNGEIHRLIVKNESLKEKNIKIFSYVEFCLWDAQDDMTNLQRNLNTGEVEIEGAIIFNKTEYRERRDHFSFYWVNGDIDGFDTDRDTFVGLYNDVSAPSVVVKGKSMNSVASGWAPIASHSISITLKPGEEKVLIYILGYVENDKEDKWEAVGRIKKNRAKEMINKFSTNEDVEIGLSELKKHWDKLLSVFVLDSHDDKLYRMVNIWNPYQCMVTFNLSRSASFFETGIGRGIGFRDSNQDILGFVHQMPEKARERIIDLAATQFENGGAYHQYQPLNKKGNHDIGGGFNDDPLWLILAVSSYIKETGDYGILDEQVPYDCNPNNTDTLIEHCRCAFYNIVDNVGPHGLPLIGHADWNDCLNLNCFSSEPGESFQNVQNCENDNIAESVFIAGMLVYIGPEFVQLCKHKGMTKEAKKVSEEIKKMKKKILQNGYDGEWFLRAYDAFGNKVGSKECVEGKIFIEPQGMCVMGGIGIEEGLAEKALDSVEKYLDTKYGLIVQNPPYSKYYLNLGEISSYPPGYKENAGIFCHNNPWVVIAETVIGRGDRAFEIYSKITPAYLEDISDIHKTEPYVYSQMIAGKDADSYGEAKNSWLTGTAAWNFVAITQYILGIRPDYDGLRVDPCIPKDWDGYKVIRKFRGIVYNITIRNPNHISKGVKKLIIDGKEINGNIISFEPNKANCNVEVIMG